jgi:hypothetical protein
MRAAPAALISHLNALRAEPDALAAIADCYTFTLRIGLILTYTDADVPVNLNGYRYLASSVLVSGLKFKCSVRACSRSATNHRVGEANGHH